MSHVQTCVAEHLERESADYVAFDAEAHRLRLIETIASVQQWRRAQADRYPDDRIAVKRSLRVVGALGRLMSFVRDLPANDRDLRRRFRSLPVRLDGTYKLNPETLTILGRFGIDRGAWQEHKPTEAQMRNVLRRADGSESRARAEANA